MRSPLRHHRTLLDKIFKKADDIFDAVVLYVRHHVGRVVLYCLGAGFILAGLFLVWAATLQLPDLSSLQSARVEQSIKIYDRTGTVLLYDLHNDAQRTVVPLSAISPNIQDATIAVENPDFYTDKGIEPTAILRAFVADVLSGSASQGGSTITQQVVKNTVLTNDKSLTRKLKEAVLSIKMDETLSKDQILELYLNSVPYGGTIYGAEEASMDFFGVHASDVDLAQAAYMAAVLPAPTYYSPYGPNKAALDQRKNLVLDDMYKHGYITAAEEQAAEAEQVTFLPQHATGITAPHFVFYVEQYLENKYGPDALEEGGWTVITTLDADLQTQAETIVQQQSAIAETNYGASNMALTAVDPKNGQILVMVGSKNYFATDIPGAYNVVTTPPGRQPGSAFKPIVYAQAFSMGYTPDTVLFDLPTQFSTACAASDNTDDTPPCYSPVDYDGLWRGPMTLRDALAQSINVPAVKLLYLVGINNAISLAKAMGITTLGDANQYGLTLVLGGGEVTPLELTSAYGTFATDGSHCPTTPILKITDASGNVIEDDTQPVCQQVLSPTVSEEINDVLSDPVARAPLGEGDIFNFGGHDVAVKTGTTNDTRDAWTIGYTPDIAVGIWAGNNDNTPMVKKVSGFIVGPAWAQFMNYAITKYPDDAFTRGQYPVPANPALRGIWQQPGSDGSIHSILYWVDKSDPTGPQPSNPAQDPQFAYWEYPVEQWAAQNGFTHLQPGIIDTSVPPGTPGSPFQNTQPSISPTGGAVIPQ